MNYLIIGSTGYIGRNLVKKLLAEGNLIYVLSRDKEKALNIFRKTVVLVNWEDLKINPLNIKEEAIDCVINLAGEPLAAHRWNTKSKSKIMGSRVNTTRQVVDAISKTIISPKVFINASAKDYYGPHNDEELRETDEAGNDFLAGVCKKWESEALEAEQYGVRVVLLRTSIVLGKEGALKQMLPPFKMFVGGTPGKGTQWFSWIHIDDLVNVIKLASENTQIVGPLNAATPNPVRMREFTKTLGKVLHRPSFFRVPYFIMRIAYGEIAQIIVTGQKLNSEKLLRSGFKFTYPTISEALKDILQKPKATV